MTLQTTLNRATLVDNLEIQFEPLVMVFLPRRNYTELSTYDFECLMRDLLSAEWGFRLEVFSPGPDGGTDVRLLRTADDQLITVQCKHSPGKSWSDISGHLRHEAQKISDLQLGEYWLATSAGLSPKAKSRAAELFNKQALVPEHVLAFPDIDAMLNRHPDVERSNYKLYLTSAAVLELLVRPDLFLHAQDLRSNITDRRKYYVQGPSLRKAQEILSERNCCIISGPPGVGKSTLAEMLTLQLIEEGYTPYWVSEDIREMDQLWRPDQHQVFVYDDFLGQNALNDKLGKNEDSRILAALRRLQSSQMHKLIMTTREYILAAAQQTYERMQDQEIAYSKIAVDLSQYSTFQKAHIFYNHVYFSNIPSAARIALHARLAHNAIIEHPNYNPRLIRLIIDSAVTEGGHVAGRGFPDYAKSGLDNPRQLWDHIYTQQLTDSARDILITLLTFDRDVAFEDFREAVKYYCNRVRRQFSIREFQNGLSVCDGAFINVLIVSGLRVVRFSNPGIRDYLLSYLTDNVSIFNDLATSVVWPEQALTLCRIVEPPPHGATSLIRASLYRDELAQHSKRNPMLIVGACLSVVGQPSAAWHKYTNFRGDEGMIRQESNDEILFARAVQCSGDVNGSPAAQVLAAARTKLIPSWEKGVGSKQSTLMFLRTVHDMNDTDSFAQLFRAAEAWFYDSTEDADDYSYAIDLQADFSETSSRRSDELIEGFLGYAERELEHLEGLSDIDEILYTFDVIESVARALVVTSAISELLERVSRHISMLEPDDNDGLHRAFGHNSDPDEGDVVGLFKTL